MVAEKYVKKILVTNLMANKHTRELGIDGMIILK
jgi:hypothetical protein